MRRLPLTPVTASHRSAPSIHKHGSSMASNISGSSSSSDRQRVAQHRLRVIAGHLQRSAESDSVIQAAECKASVSESVAADSETRTVPRRRYEALRWSHSAHVIPI